jgi:hypothetical protein
MQDRAGHATTPAHDGDQRAGCGRPAAELAARDSERVWPGVSVFTSTIFGIADPTTGASDQAVVDGAVCAMLDKWIQPG